MKRVVLVRTIGPRNAGMALRACANFGPCELWLVAPVRPAILVHPEFEQMSHGVPDAAARVRVVETLEEALVDRTTAVAFTARARGRAREDWRRIAPDLRELEADPEQELALVFGSEENGLENSEAEQCRILASIGTSTEHTSINLAMSVGIVLASLFEGSSLRRREGTRHMTRGQDLSYLKQHLKHVLGGKVARGDAAKRDIEESIERIFTRAPVESRDARAWHKVLRELGGELAPQDLGLTGPDENRRRETALRRLRGEEPDSSES